MATIADNIAELMRIRLEMKEFAKIPDDVPFEQYGAWLAWAGEKAPTQPLMADFVNKRYSMDGVPCRFEDIFEFERLSKAWDFERVKLEEYDVNEPRLSDKGLMIEVQRTNIALRSSGRIVSGDGSTYYTENEAVAPTGEVVNSVKGDFKSHYGAPQGSRLEIFWGLALGADNYHTLSFFYKPVTDIASVSLLKVTMIGHVDRSVGASVKEVGNGWFYFSETFTYNGGGESRASLLISKGDSAPSDETPEIFIAGVQMEQGRFPTSITPTENIPATRAPDILNIPLLPTQTITGDWDEGVTYETVDNIATFTGYGYIRNITVEEL